MKRPLFKFLLVFLMSLLLSGGIERPAPLSAQKVLPRQRPFRRASLLRPKRIGPVEPVYWVKDILQGYSLDSILSTGDGGYLVSGWSSSPYSEWTIRLDSDGMVAWRAEKQSDSPLFGKFSLHGMESTPEGNIVGAGNYSTSTNTDAMAIKFTPDGEVLWAYHYGGPYVDTTYWISPAQDGGCILTGQSLRDLGTGEDAFMIWAIKIDASGTVQWDRGFACLDEETFIRTERDICGVQTSDGGYAIAANTRLAGSGEFDFLLIKLDPSGNVEWQKTYGGPGYESLFRKGPHLQATADGGMVLAGSTTSYGSGYTDIWVLKLKAGGDIEWQKAIGGSDYEYCNSIRIAPDGGYILAGDAGGRFGLVKLSTDGEVEWDRGFSGQYAEAVAVAEDGSYFMGGKFGSDVLVMKVSSQGLISDSCGFAGPPSHVVQDTTAVPVSVWFEPFVLSPEAVPFTASFNQNLAIFTETLCWNLNQPPVPVSLVRSVNRGLFRGEAFNTLTWEPHPANAAFPIAQYRVYRKSAGSATSEFVVIGTVSGNHLSYVDSYSDLSKEYVYALTSVDDAGHESPKSVAIGGEIVR